MAEDDVAVPDADSEGARRAFLARIEAALRASGVADLSYAYRPMPPALGRAAPLYTGLVITCAGVGSEVRVGAVSWKHQVVQARPGSIQPAAMEAVRAQLQALGLVTVTG